MKFKDATIDELINWLHTVKRSPDFDCHRVLRVSGEITIRDSELKSDINTGERK